MKKLSRKLGFAILLLATITIAAGCSQKSSVRKLKIGHGLDQTHPVHKAMMFLAERTAEKSNGQIQITVYPSQQLGTERECLELLQIGSLGMTKVSSSVLEGFAPSFKVFSLPYIFRDDEHKFKFFESELGQQLLQSPQKFWLRGLCYYDAGSRSFYTVGKQIETPADLDGLKIRTQESPTSVKLVNALGGSATPIAWGELYTALQQGVVDGAENNPPSFYLSRHYEVCKYYSINEHTSVPDVLLISTIIWDDLSEQEKIWIQEAANESYIYEKELWGEATLEALEKVKEAGVEVVYPDKTPFMEKVGTMLEEYKTEPEIYKVIQQIQAIK
ncbi:MAG: TRAP transporter substrate-binding protein [Melioribacteraceae bacterium]|nr:TRAP transporter substrate-binding protein [Melioribacteraceae bacterium]MCF8265705.1 TRAP transporter substrate-binding protein [Melioribacteraceae bacterium]MCF8413544.1 TRAP transporter substrate-binding protein [Melioribacteraceae bacterium]